MSHEDDLQRWRERYEQGQRDKAVAQRSAKPAKDVWGKPILPDPLPPPYDARRPVCVLTVEARGYRLEALRLGDNFYQGELRGVIQSIRNAYAHELGATLEIRDQTGAVIRTISWDGDGKAYPEPFGSHSV